MKKTIKLRLITAAVGLAMTAGMVYAAGNPEADAARKAKPGFTKVKLMAGQKKKITIKNKAKKAVYIYRSSAAGKVAVSRSGVITAKKAGKATIIVKQKLKKKITTIGKIKVTVIRKNSNNITTDAAAAQPVQTAQSAVTPAVQVTAAPGAQATKAPSSDPTATPELTATPEPTADPVLAPYTKEVFSINMDNTEKYTVNGAECDVEMQYFDAEVKGEYFNGGLLRDKESSIVTKSYKDGRTVMCGRYILKGKNKDGSDCSIFIEDNSIEVRDNMIITRPVIITQDSGLSFLQTADVQGRIVTEEDGTRTLSIMWNENNTDPVPFPEVVNPDNTRDYSRELFTFTIGIGASDEVKGADGVTSSMINFTCTSDCDAFKGRGVSNFVDTRMQFPGQVQTLSARYIMEGTDEDGKECKIYVENNGIDNNGMVTEPIIITDNPKWAFVETAPLHGTVSWSPSLTIHMWTTPDAK